VLKADKKKLALKGKSWTNPRKLLKKQIPVRTYYADADKKPGFFEIDTSDFSPRGNGSEFINTALLKWCRNERIQFTRSRAYRKTATVCGINAELNRKTFPITLPCKSSTMTTYTSRASA
jgi:hypothetical protein